MPVAQQPSLSEILCRLVTLDGSISLSCACRRPHSGSRAGWPSDEPDKLAHRHFLLRDHDDAIDATHADGRQATCPDGFERVFCKGKDWSYISFSSVQSVRRDPPSHVFSKHERKCAYVCRTDLKQAAFWREHSDMTIVTCTAAAGHCA